MCGIAGFVYRDARPVDRGLLKTMTDAIVHRGPDGEGFYARNGCGLGHRRLAIIDLEGGAQPISNEDDSLWTVFNGEIYNFVQLRADLEERGHVFKTHCDTEVLLHLYEEHGAAMVSKLRGMFSFAIWNEKTRELFLARDRAGKKPLYWFEDRDGIYFASELKALYTLPNAPREIDPEAIELYLAYQSIPGEKTIFRGIRRLPPASTLSWSPGTGARSEKYWELDWSRKTDLSYEDAKRRLLELIRDSVKARLVADVPLGAFLSGGVDSSVVVAAMAEFSSRVRTFSIGFPQRDFDETSYARIVAKKFGTEHEEFTVSPDALAILPKLVRHYDQPYADSSALPTYYVSEMTRRSVKVALNGDGGDEFFGGYDRYRAALVQRLYDVFTPRFARRGLERATRHFPEGSKNRSIIRKIRRFAAAGSLDTEAFNVRLFEFFDRSAREELYAPEFLNRLRGYNADDYLLSLTRAGAEDPVDRILRADTLMYLPDTLLVKVDIASMAVSLEARSPLLDTEIMEFAASLPRSWKVGLFSSKRILKEAHHGILPHEILYRKKMGFAVPLSHWFRNELYGYIQDVLLDDASLSRGYFRRTSIVRMIEEHRSGRINHANRLWALLMLELWHKEFGRGRI